MAGGDKSAGGDDVAPLGEVLQAAKAQAAESLDLSFRNMQELPEGLSTFSSLKVIDLRNNELVRLGGNEVDAKGLFPPGVRVLNISGNFMEFLGDSALAGLTALEHLDLSKNRLKALPISLQACTALTELSLSRNQLDALPSVLGEKLPLLKHLDVSYNTLRFLPDSLGKLKHLEHLSARFNQLEKVPASLGNASSLLHLDIGENFINLTSVPGTLGNLTNLKVLDLSNNHIAAVPVQLGRIAGLELLYLDNNPLTFPPPEVMGMEDPRDEPLHKTMSAESTAREACLRKTRLVKAFLAAKYKEWDEQHGPGSGSGTWESWLANWPILGEWLSALFGAQPAGYLEGAAVSMAPRAMLPPPAEPLEPELPESTAAATSIAVAAQWSREQVAGSPAKAKPGPETEVLVSRSESRDIVDAPAVPTHVVVPLLNKDGKGREACMA